MWSAWKVFGYGGWSAGFVVPGATRTAPREVGMNTAVAGANVAGGPRGPAGLWGTRAIGGLFRLGPFSFTDGSPE